MQYLLLFHGSNAYANAHPCTLYVHCLPCYMSLVTSAVCHRLVQEIFRSSIDLILCKSIARLWSGCHELFGPHPQLRPQCAVWMLFRFTSRLFLGRWTMPRYPIYFTRRWTNHALHLSSRSAIHDLWFIPLNTSLFSITHSPILSRIACRCAGSLRLCASV